MHAALDRVVASGQVLLGPETEAFEHEFAAFCGRHHAVAVASGTEALRLTFAALGLGPGDEVVVPAFTAVPTAAAVCAVGATPVPVDVGRTTALIDWDAAARAVTSRTRAVVPVHLYGRPAEPRDVGVPIVGDAAQAHGAVGDSPAVATAYSFYPTKNLGGIGDGGAVVTDDAALAASLRRLRVHAMEPGYLHSVPSTNARLSEFEAAVLRDGLTRLSNDNARRRAIAAHYRDAAPHLTWPEPHADHVYHLCVVRVADRDGFRAAMPFDTAIHYPVAIVDQPGYRAFARTECPEARRWAAECVTLPCYPELTDAEVESVAKALSCHR
jgi:dTDP-4-amino-4,6-dideoxygalactose transaminase